MAVLWSKKEGMEQAKPHHEVQSRSIFRVLGVSRSSWKSFRRPGSDPTGSIMLVSCHTGMALMSTSMSPPSCLSNRSFLPCIRSVHACLTLSQRQSFRQYPNSIQQLRIYFREYRDMRRARERAGQPHVLALLLCWPRDRSARIGR